MDTTLSALALDDIRAQLSKANAAFNKAHPGDPSTRQPVHTVYGGAHLFKSDTAPKMGAVALRTLQEYAPDFAAFARSLGLRGADKLPKSAAQAAALKKRLDKDPDAVRAKSEPAWFAHTVYARVFEKLKQEPVEDFRIDYEDGYGNRPDPEEDGHAASAAEEAAKAAAAGTLPPFIGIRVKPFSEELFGRSARTLEIFVTTLVRKMGGRLPPNFVVTIPKVTIPEQVTALVRILERLESKTALAPGSLKLELMIETPQSILDGRGECALPRLAAAAEGRLTGAHFGTYDYTASCNITAAYQDMAHPACDFAKHMMQVAFAGTGVMLSDGATNVMPIGPHRPAPGKNLTAKQSAENRAVVHRAWRLGYGHIRHSLETGYYQGWDLNPAQLPVRYAAVYAFFLESLELAVARLKNFIDKASQATLIGDVFDDAATGQGLLNYFLRGMGCGAITEAEARSTGLTLEEIRTRSFLKILNLRRGRAG